MSLSEVARAGKRLATLEQLRDYLANAIESCESMRDLAALGGRLQSVLAEIDELSPKEPAGDGIDEISARRSARRSSPAKGAGRSAVKG